jgi:putative modified peptide
MAGIDPPIVDELLDRLANDDGFRAAFAADPAAALASLGAQDLSLAPCMEVEELASKEAIAAARDELREQLILGTLGLQPVRLSHIED